MFGRLRYWALASGRYACVQIVVQLLGFVTGILIIRKMSQREYAFYTIANTMQGTMNLLADMGISSAVLAMGGRVWQDRIRLGEVVKTALRIRYWLASAAALVVAPFLVWLLVRQGAYFLYAGLLLAIVLVSFGIQLAVDIFLIAPRLHTEVAKLQRLDLISSTVRLSLIGVACLFWMDSGTALLATSLTLILQILIVRQWAGDLVDLNASPTPENRTQMFQIIRTQAPNVLFYCFQGQITIWLISIFGKAQSIAEIGALGRLAMVFSIINAVVGTLVIPRFARCQNPNLLLRRYWQILGACGLLTVALLSVTVTFTPQLLWLLGRRYEHLHFEFLLITASSLLSFLTATLWSLNCARTWFDYSWLNIPGTLLAQVILLLVLDVSSLQGVILFGFFSQLPSFVLNILFAWRGFRIEFQQWSLAPKPLS